MALKQATWVAWLLDRNHGSWRGVFGDGRMRGSTRLDSNEENYNGDWQVG